MYLISSLLRHLLYPSFSRSGVFRAFRNRKMKNALTVVTYHGVFPKKYKVEDRLFDGNLIRSYEFQEQLRLLKSNYNVIRPEEFNACFERDDSLPPNSILITCDDGLLNNVTEMLPILKHEGLSCLFFITTESAKSFLPILWHEELYLMLKRALRDLAGAKVKNGNLPREAWWKFIKEFSRVGQGNRQEVIDRLRQELGLKKDWGTFIRENQALKERFMLLSLPDLELLRNAGMTLGSHTCTHPILSLLPRNVAQYEIEASRHNLEHELGVRVWALSYPFGDPASVTSREMSIAEHAGYRCGFINYGGLVASAKESPFCLQRVHVSADMTLAEFEAHVSGFHTAFRDRIIRQKTI